ncbi:MAG: hypothetical protein AB7T63_14915 [Planctomycetota bacterium]
MDDGARRRATAAWILTLGAKASAPAPQDDDEHAVRAAVEGSDDPEGLTAGLRRAVTHRRTRGEIPTTASIAHMAGGGADSLPEAIDPAQARDEIEALKREEAMDAILGGVEALGLDVALGVLRDELHRRGFTDDEIDAHTRRGA